MSWIYGLCSIQGFRSFRLKNVLLTDIVYSYRFVKELTNCRSNNEAIGQCFVLWGQKSRHSNSDTILMIYFSIWYWQFDSINLAKKLWHWVIITDNLISISQNVCWSNGFEENMWWITDYYSSNDTYTWFKMDVLFTTVYIQTCCHLIQFFITISSIIYKTIPVLLLYLSDTILMI